MAFLSFAQPLVRPAVVQPAIPAGMLTQPASSPPQAAAINSAIPVNQGSSGTLTPAAPLPWQNTQPTPPVTVAQTTPSTVNSVAQAAPGMIGAPQQANATMVSPASLVSNRTAELLAENSPIIQRARAQANEESNSKGMLNSSMAIQAADTAALGAAVPIANADVQAQNAVASQNATAANTIGIANMDTANQLKQAQAGFETNTNQYNAGATNAASTLNAQQTNVIGTANTAAQNTAIISQLDQANKIQLADIQASYNTVMQANASAGNLFQTTMQALNNIQQSTTMDANTKQIAVNQHVQLLKSGLSMFSAINNLNLSQGLNFSV